jgi:hypothetical protein
MNRIKNSPNYMLFVDAPPNLFDNYQSLIVRKIDRVSAALAISPDGFQTLSV